MTIIGAMMPTLDETARGEKYKSLAIIVVVAAVVTMLLRSGIRIGAVDDVGHMSIYASDSDFKRSLLEPQILWARWTTIVFSWVLDYSGISFYVFNKSGYFLYEFLLSLMNALLVSYIFKSTSLRLIPFVLFLNLCDSWLVLANFDIVTLSLVTCFALASFYIWQYAQNRGSAVTGVAVTFLICGSYQGFLYTFIAAATLLVIADYLAEEAGREEFLKRLGLVWASIIGGIVAYVLVSKLVYALLGTGNPKVGLSFSDMFVRVRHHLAKALENGVLRDWLVYPEPFTLNWRIVSYVLLAAVAVYALRTAAGACRTRFMVAFGVTFVLLLAFLIQPLQLLSGHKAIPYRAFAFTNYLTLGLFAIATLAILGGTLRDTRFSRALVGYFAVMVFVMSFHTMAIVHSLELNRARDMQIVRGLEIFYAQNAIPKNAPLAVALSSPGDHPVAAYAGKHGVDSLGSLIRTPWSYRPFIKLSSLLRPTRATQAQELAATAACAKYKKDGWNVKYEYSAPLVIICL